MDRMLFAALILWVIVVAMFRIGGTEAAKQAEPEFDPRAPAFFTHDDHMERAECTACHHRYVNGKNVLEEDELDGGDAMRCATCHNDKTSIDRMEAFHTQCIGCHRTLKNKGEADGPRTCGTCHPKQMPNEDAALLIAR